ncbi:hypothetical protein C8J57DRAFT_533622 [Mycena rebaudengoi]|nr:hypothetical protein C8J57DRAFT_533622 [Mycena rebaudengoi]
MNWTDREETSSTGSSSPPTPSADRLYSPIAGNSPWPSLQSQTTKDVFQSVLQGRKSWKTLRGGETVWPLDLEAALLEGLENYIPDDSRETRMLGRFPKRNRFISDYIFEKTGKRRSAKQVGSRLQQLRESCGGQKLLHLLSPFRRPAYNGSSGSSDDSPMNSPVSPALSGRMIPHTSPPRHIVMCIDIVPEGAPDTFDHSGNSSWSDDGDVIHASDRPRRLGTINPTVTFTSQDAVVAQSRFTVYSEELVLHAETAPLVLVMDGAPQESGFLYSTALVPEYWKIISESPDPTRFTIFQEVVNDKNSAIIFSATYNFRYPSRQPRASNTRMDLDSFPSASVTANGCRNERYPLYSEWSRSKGNSPGQGYPAAESNSPTCFPSALSNYIL